MRKQQSVQARQEVEIDYGRIDKELKRYRQQLEDQFRDTTDRRQWRVRKQSGLNREKIARTTILLGGLTPLHDELLAAALASLDYRTEFLPTPDDEALHLGKEYGNRGQCNPTYYTVGNLIKHLTGLEQKPDLNREAICKHYVFLTAGGCGPCRFGLYLTEYRKALSGAGFEDFRVLAFRHDGGIVQTGESAGIAFTPKFFHAVLRALLAADVMNILTCRLRPYEKTAGASDKALGQCRAVLKKALTKRRNMRRALRRCRQILDTIALERLPARPKVSIIGEFWAATTVGDGNYGLHKFLESEGAECEIQPVIGRVLHNIWENKYNARAALRSPFQMDGLSLRELVSKTAKVIRLRAGSFALRRWFGLYARAAGLRHYHLADMDKLARLAAPYYPLESQGGEAHLEVGHLLENLQERGAHLVLSIKPFGCMPSSGVSDGIQSLITARHPEANFLAIETSGDGAVNVYSRIQMALFKTRQRARQEYTTALSKAGWDEATFRTKALQNKQLKRGTYYPKPKVTATAANIIYAIAPRTDKN